MERESLECKSGVSPLAQWAEIDVPRAVAVLRQLTVALEAYVDLATFDAASPPEPPAARIEPPVEPAVVQEYVAETVEAKPEPAQAMICR